MHFYKILFSNQPISAKPIVLLQKGLYGPTNSHTALGMQVDIQNVNFTNSFACIARPALFCKRENGAAPSWVYPTLRGNAGGLFSIKTLTPVFFLVYDLFLRKNKYQLVCPYVFLFKDTLQFQNPQKMLRTAYIERCQQRPSI